MKLLWHGTWMDVPGYCALEPGVLINVDAAVPMWRIEAASARPTRQPRRKVAVFLMTDGLRSTVRKAQTKRNEPRFSGDYRVAVVAGRTIPANHPVVAFALRVPPASQQLLVHERLLQEVSYPVLEEDLAQVATTLAAEEALIGSIARQNYLYSGMEPPEDLVSRWDRALGKTFDAKGNGKRGHNRPLTAGRPGEKAPVMVRPPQGTAGPADAAVQFDRSDQPSGRPVALLGAGDYARTEIIPALRAAGLSLAVVADREPQIATLVCQGYGFSAATTDPHWAIAHLPPKGLVVVATAHDSHAELACRAAEAGHRVFLEKPPTVTSTDVACLAEAMTSRPGMIEIGYNRRYHPLVRRVQSRLQGEDGPTSITCTVRELSFRPDHWYFWANQGTQFTGNLCHWIDLAISVLDGQPLPVSITLSPQIPNRLVDDEERVLTVTFEDGSVLTVVGTARGDDIRGVQEQIDIRRGRTTISIDDLWKVRIRHGGFERYYRTAFRNKAHGQMYREALGRVLRDEPAVYAVRDMIVVSAIQIAASDLVHGNETTGEIPAWLAPTLRATTRQGSAPTAGAGTRARPGSHRSPRHSPAVARS
jgi:predicted dehydrogenase